MSGVEKCQEWGNVRSGEMHFTVRHMFCWASYTQNGNRWWCTPSGTRGVSGDVTDGRQPSDVRILGLSLACSRTLTSGMDSRDGQ
ncbi:hypothetical protein ACOMHN_051151 [Nucella lapillus]